MSVIIRKSLLELIFSGAFMKRWNDKLRPMELVEVDKQAHKMIVAWLLFLLNSRDLDVARKRALGETIIEGGLFDYLYRLVITDIKPPVFYRIKENPDDYRTLTNWVVNELRPRILPLGDDLQQVRRVSHAARGQGPRTPHPARRAPLCLLLGIQASQIHQQDGPRAFGD